MNNDNHFDEIMPRNRRQEEENTRARARDDQECEERGERDDGITRGSDQNDSRLPVLEALQDLLMNGANADPNSNEGRLWCQMNQMAVNALTALGNDVTAPYSSLSMVEKIEKVKDSHSNWICPIRAIRSGPDTSRLRCKVTQDGGQL